MRFDLVPFDVLCKLVKPDGVYYSTFSCLAHNERDAWALASNAALDGYQFEWELGREREADDVEGFEVLSIEEA